MNMQQVRLQNWSFLFAAFLHLLVFLFFSYGWIHQQKKNEDKENLYIPSYAYQEAAHTTAQKTVTPKTPPIKDAPAKDTQKKEVPVSKHGIEKPVFDQREVSFNEVVDISAKNSSEPVHLIGDKSKTPQPLIIILGKALTSKLSYPKSAIDLNVGGISVIGFVLHPDGQVTDVRLLKTSRVDVLDEAAIFAANHISPVFSAGPYVKEPMPIVFGIVFGSGR
jgi:TonB family protein